jgi:NADH-quinone oxidoreductase subunit I
MKIVSFEPLNFAERLYLPEIFKGLANTFRHLVAKPNFTVQYPEVKRPEVRGFHGEHYLKKDSEGRPKCVACFMCSTICPANCIHIEAGPSPDPDRDKIPVRFDINMLVCIYCGLCEEACPCDAIALSTRHFTVVDNRKDAVRSIDRLLADCPEPPGGTFKIEGHQTRNELMGEGPTAELAKRVDGSTPPVYESKST